MINKYFSSRQYLLYPVPCLPYYGAKLKIWVVLRHRQNFYSYSSGTTLRGVIESIMEPTVFGSILLKLRNSKNQKSFPSGRLL